MRKLALFTLGAILLRSSGHAEVHPFPATFKTETISTNGAQIYVRVGGSGPAVVMLHGYGETGDMWEPLAAKLAKDHTVVVPDLRGMGLSGHPVGGFAQKTHAHYHPPVPARLNTHP